VKKKLKEGNAKKYLDRVSIMNAVRRSGEFRRRKNTENKNFQTERETETDTHKALGLLVGAGIEQQTHAVRVTIASGIYQRRISVLSVEFPKSNTVSP
jgi:hypothetical protein